MSRRCFLDTTRIRFCYACLCFLLSNKRIVSLLIPKKLPKHQNRHVPITTFGLGRYVTLCQYSLLLNVCARVKTVTRANVTPSSAVMSRRDSIHIPLITSGTYIIHELRQLQPAQAIDNGTNIGMVDVDTVATLLRAVPTFTIVDEDGVPYMVVGEDAKVTAYFFLDYKEAKRILQVATSTADKAISKAKSAGIALTDDEVVNPWRRARISTVPLDVAVSLAIKSGSRQVGSGNYYSVASSETDIEDALALTGKSSLAEGKVPLFYYKDFTLQNTKTGDIQNPLYFKRSDLEFAYRTYIRSKGLPIDDKIQVTELFAVLSEMVKPDSIDDQLKTLVFIPTSGSEQGMKECERRSNNKPPFVFGKRNIIL